jgi:hypothetical protein
MGESYMENEDRRYQAGSPGGGVFVFGRGAFMEKHCAFLGIRLLELPLWTPT